MLELVVLLSSEEAENLEHLALARNLDASTLASDYLRSRILIERRRIHPVERHNTLSGQWPTLAIDDNAAFEAALWPDNWETDHFGAIVKGQSFLERLLTQILENGISDPAELSKAKRLKNMGPKINLDRVPGSGVQGLTGIRKLARDHGGDSVHLVIAHGLESFELHVAAL